MYDIDGDDRGITDGSDPVTMFVIHPNVTASVNGLFSEQYNHTSYCSSLQLAFRLTCLPPHSGPDCSLIYDRSSTYSSHSKFDTHRRTFVGMSQQLGNEVERQGKANKSSTDSYFFLKKEKELPWVGFEPTTLCMSQ